MSFLFKDKTPIKQVKNEQVKPSVNLSGHKLEMDSQGVWKMLDSNNIETDQRIRDLEHKNMALQLELEQERNERLRLARIAANLDPTAVDNVSNSSAEIRVREAERELELERLRNIQMRAQLEELVFRERVLLAMCTIAEGDYMKLCEEAGIDSRNLRTNSSLLSNEYDENKKKRKTRLKSKKKTA